MQRARGRVGGAQRPLTTYLTSFFFEIMHVLKKKFFRFVKKKKTKFF